MKLMEKWKSYVGPKDERIQAELNKIYKIGYNMLSAGFLVMLYYEISLKHVASMHELETLGSSIVSFSTPEILFFIWFLVVNAILGFLQYRKGFIDGNRFGEADVFPLGYYTIISVLAALLGGVLATGFRALAEYQLLGAAEVNWLGNLILGIAVAAMVFLLVFLVFLFSFRAAKNRREKLLNQLDEQ